MAEHSSWGFTQSWRLEGKHWIIIGGILIHLLITFNAPMQMLADANYDDQLYIKLAAYMLAGDWLGPYDGQTLQKGIGAPLFIALFSALGIPFRMAQSLAYTFGVTLVIWALRRLGTSRFVAWTAWSLAMFSPHFWDTHNMRVSRDQILATLTLWMLGLGLWMLHRQRKGSNIFWIWGLSAGLFWGWVWNTREESPWTILPMLLIGGISYLMTNESFKWRKLRGLAVILLGFWGFNFANKTLNYLKYGVFETIEVWQSEFAGAYGSLARILPKHHHSAVPITRANIEKARLVSPTFDKIMAHFPGDLVNYPPNENFREGEFSSGWWMSGLKTAIYTSGLGRTGPQAKDAWKQLSIEINTACEDGRLPCGPWRKTVIPQITPAVVWNTISLATKNILTLTNFANFDYSIVPSRGSPYLQNVFAELLNTPLVPSENSVVVRATSEFSSDVVAMSVDGGIDTNDNRKPVTLIPLSVRHSDKKHFYSAEIHFQSDCVNCAWTFRTAAGQTHRIPLDSLIGKSVSPKDVQITVDHHFSAQSSKFSPVLTRARLLYKIMPKLASIYQLAFYIWLLFGLYWLARHHYQSSSRMIVWAFVLIPLTAIYGRLGVLAVTEFTSFRTSTPLYYSPLYALLFLWPAFLIAIPKVKLWK